MKIWANTIVHNEENFIWFALMSVVDHVDKILIWDTGSKDRTFEIIKEIERVKGKKIDFRQVGEVDNDKFTKLRQGQLEESCCDWILILDGDEIWWDDSIKNLIKEITLKGDRIDGVVVPMIVPVGDIYHFQPEDAGRYRLLGKFGHFNLRAINKKIPGLHLNFPHPRESYLDQNNIPIQEKKRTIFLNSPYLHLTHLRRSDNKQKINKYKYELGNKAAKDFKYPEILYKPYPKIVSSPWQKLSKVALVKSAVITPLRKVKRRIFD